MGIVFASFDLTKRYRTSASCCSWTDYVGGPLRVIHKSAARAILNFQDELGLFFFVPCTEFLDLQKIMHPEESF